MGFIFGKGETKSALGFVLEMLAALAICAGFLFLFWWVVLYRFPSASAIVIGALILIAIIANIVGGIRRDWDSFRWTIAAWASLLCLYAAGALRDSSAYGWGMLLLLVGALLLLFIHEKLQESRSSVQGERERICRLAAELEELREGSKGPRD